MTNSIGEFEEHNIEMSSTSILVAAAFAVAAWSGAIQVATPLGWFSLFTLMCGPACLVMGVDMLLHHKHYTEGHSAPAY